MIDCNYLTQIIVKKKKKEGGWHNMKIKWIWASSDKLLALRSETNSPVTKSQEYLAP